MASAGDRGPFPDLATLITWPVAVANEVLTLPETMRAARVLVEDLADLTHSLAQTAALLGDLSRRINGLLDQGEAVLGELAVPLTSTIGQVNSIESSVTELRNTFFTILRRVPGAKRAIEEAAPGALRDGDTQTLTDVRGRPAPVSRPGLADDDRSPDV